MAKITSLNELEKKGRVIKGRWELGPGHRLAYRRDEDSRLEELEFETSLIAAEPEALVLSVSGKQKDGKMVTRTARLGGAWRLNERNQIEFEVERKSGPNDVLTFRGSWKVDDQNEIIYTWRRTTGKRKTTELGTLTFKGFWSLSGNQRLTYTLEGASDETFRFTGAFQTKSILAKKGEIRYQLGATLEGKRRARTLTLFGKWKLSDKLELVFEIESEKGRKSELRFGAEYQFTKDLACAAKLTGRQGEPLGVELILTRDFLDGNAEAFVRLRKTAAESAVEGGVTVPW